MLVPTIVSVALFLSACGSGDSQASEPAAQSPTTSGATASPGVEESSAPDVSQFLTGARELVELCSNQGQDKCIRGNEYVPTTPEIDEMIRALCRSLEDNLGLAGATLIGDSVDTIVTQPWQIDVLDEANREGIIQCSYQVESPVEDLTILVYTTQDADGGAEANAQFLGVTEKVAGEPPTFVESVSPLSKAIAEGDDSWVAILFGGNLPGEQAAESVRASLQYIEER